MDRWKDGQKRYCVGWQGEAAAMGPPTDATKQTHIHPHAVDINAMLCYRNKMRVLNELCFFFFDFREEGRTKYRSAKPD